jgi:glycosyltransferase involved in cell wall biosynthesis
MMIDNDIKKICLFNTCKIWGGGEKWHHDIAIKFQHKGHRIIVCTNSKSELSLKLKKTNIPVFEIKISNLSFLNPFKIFRIYKILKKHQINVIILGLPSDVKTAGFAAKLAGAKKIIYRRGTALPVKNSFLNRFIFQYIVTDVITNSLDIKRKFLEHNPKLFPTQRIHIIYNGVEINENILANQPKLNGHGKPIVIGNAGRLVEQKGQKYLIELASLLKKQNIDFKIKIAGKGILKNSLYQYAKKLNVLENIDFLDFMSDMGSFFKSIDIFVLPSIHEGSANIVIEAMAYSKPVVAFNISSMPELIENHQTGFLVPFGDIHQLAERVTFLIDHPQTKYEMGKAAKQKVIDQFDFNKNIAYLESIL